MQLGSLSQKNTDDLREFLHNDVRILWINDFYDIPLQGMAEVCGTRYLFEIIDRSVLGTENESAVYWLIALSPDQLRDEEQWHDLFCSKVGTHFDYTGRPAPRSEQVCPDEFYDPYRFRQPSDFTSNEVFGWFRLGSLHL